MFVRVIVPLVLVGLVVYSLVDIAGSDDDELGGLPKWLWVILVIFLPLAGSVAWIVVHSAARRRRTAYGRTRPGGHGSAGHPGGARRPGGPTAPDDDPEFLWLLEQARRKREREKRAGSTPPQDDPEDDPTG